MMSLYEVQNGWMGESHVRVYVWAASEPEARSPALESFRKVRASDDYARAVNVRRLFGADDPPFATSPSDAGFDDGDE